MQQAKAKATYYAQSFLKSQHEFKMGFQYSKGSAVTNLGIGPQGTYLYSYYGSLYRAVQDPYQYGGVTQDVGVFVDDNVTVGDRLTLNLGVRYDHNTGNIPDYDRLTSGHHRSLLLATSWRLERHCLVSTSSRGISYRRASGSHTRRRPTAAR